jgi:acetate---CoA ligase (ADP-forming)
VLPDFTRRAPLVSPDRLRRFFGSRSIAVVGASSSSSWGANLLNSLELGSGLKRLTVVHPRNRELFGRRTIPSLRDLNEPVDLAYLMAGPAHVPGILEDAAAAGVKNAVVLAAGYGEAGEQGRERQRQLAEQAVDLGISVLGPNTIGYINAVDGIAPWSVAMQQAPLAGPVGAVFESGSMARATFEFAQAHGVGSTLWASVGNSAIITSLDVVDYLVEDESTRSIALFLEAVREPDRLMLIARKAMDSGKPIIAFKAGRSEQGKKSAQAHTGAIATDDAIVDAIFRQAGIARVDSIEELVAAAGLAGYSRRLPRGRRMGVVTSSGGGCNIIADLAERDSITLPPWQDTTAHALREKLPDFASVLNPLDTTGFGHARARPRPTKAEDDLMEIAAEDPGIDFIYNMMTPLPAERPADPTFIESRMKIVGGIVEASPVPVVLSSNTCLDVGSYAQQLLAENGLYLLPGAHLAMSAIGHMLRWADRRAEIEARPAAPGRPDPYPGPVADGPWSEARGRDFLRGLGVPVVPATLATSAGEASSACEAVGGPCVLKVCSSDIAHKSDIGGVVLNVTGAAAGATAYQRIIDRASQAAPNAEVDGVLVSPMRPDGVELLVGIKVDPAFGPVLAVGLGGIWVEILRDVVLRLLPADEAIVGSMLRELKGYSLLAGARGQAGIDLDRTAMAIVQIAQAALSLGDRLSSLEVNPLRITEYGPEVLDVLVTTGSETNAEGPR